MKVSFVIPSKNCAAWLPHAVSSVLKQDRDCEIVIVNDGSTDSTAEYLVWLHEKHPETIIYHASALGRSKARNIGNELATGDIICVLDADDIASPDRAKKTIEKISKGAQFVYGTAEMMDFSGTKLKTLQADVFNLDKALERGTNGIVHSTVAYTKGIAKKFPYSEEPEISDNGLDDWFLELQIAKAKIPIDFIPTPIAGYRVLQSAISSTRDPKIVDAVKSKYLKRYSPMLEFAKP